MTDPPYGKGEATGKNRNRAKPTSFARPHAGPTLFVRDYGRSDWDDHPPDKATIDLIRQGSR